MVLIKTSKENISKSNAQVGQIIRNQKPVWNGFPFVSALIRLYGLSVDLPWLLAGVRDCRVLTGFLCKWS